MELRLDFRHRRALSKGEGGTETGPLHCGKVPVGLGILRHQDAPSVGSDVASRPSLRIDERWNQICDSRRKPTSDSVLVVDRAETPWSVTGQAGIGGTPFFVFFTRLRVLQLVCRHHLRQTPGLSSLLLGGHVPTPNPSSMREGASFLGDWCLAWWAYNSDWSAHQPPW